MEDLEDRFTNSKKKKENCSGPKPRKENKHSELTTREFNQPGDPTYGHLRSYFHPSMESSPLIGGFLTEFTKKMKALRVNLRVKVKEGHSLLIKFADDTKKRKNQATKSESKEEQPYIRLSGDFGGEIVHYRERKIATKEELAERYIPPHQQMTLKRTMERCWSKERKHAKAKQTKNVYQTEFWIKVQPYNNVYWSIVVNQEEVEEDNDDKEELNNRPTQEGCEDEEAEASPVQLEVTSMELSYNACCAFEFGGEWKEIKSAPMPKRFNYWYGSKPITEGLDEMVLIEDGKHKVQAIRERQSKKKALKLERKTREKKTNESHRSNDRAGEDY